MEKQKVNENLIILNGLPMIIPRRNAERLLQIELWIEGGALLGELQKELGLTLTKLETKIPEYVR